MLGTDSLRNAAPAEAFTKLHQLPLEMRFRRAQKPNTPTTQWLEALPIVVAGAAAVLYGPSLALSSTFGFVGLAIAVYALARGRRRWIAALGVVLNVPLVVIGVLILLPG